MSGASPPETSVDLLARIDPELREAYPRQVAEIMELFLSDLAAAHALHRAARHAVDRAFAGDRQSFPAPGLDGDPDVPIVSFAAAAQFDDCAILWLHGGGYWAGSPDTAAAHAFAHIAPVYSVGYRLAPDHPAPAAARDVCAALEWLSLHKKPRAIAVAGESAGGGLAASAAILNRDRSGPFLDLQLLLYPMLDDRLDTPSSKLALPPRFGRRDAIAKAWMLYLGGAPASPYAAASRVEDATGLPPAHIAVGDLDHLCDESVAYAERLRSAGIPVELCVYAGAPHGFDHIAPEAQISRRARAACEAALRRALAGSNAA